MLLAMLLVVLLGAVAEIGCPVWFAFAPRSGAFVVQERLEIGFSIAAFLVLLYVTCAAATGELFF